jgi:prepilin peptidase CpaA
MNLVVLGPDWAVTALLVLLAVAAVQDALMLRISNLISLAILGLAIAAAVIAGPQWALWQNLAFFAAMLALGTWAFSSGMLGGGDVKLLAVTALWFNFSGAGMLLLATAISGGFLAIIILSVRQIGWSEGARKRVVILRPKGGIPYGVAIAAGAMLTASLLARGEGRPAAQSLPATQQSPAAVAQAR